LACGGGGDGGCWRRCDDLRHKCGHNGLLDQLLQPRSFLLGFLAHDSGSRGIRHLFTRQIGHKCLLMRCHPLLDRLLGYLDWRGCLGFDSLIRHVKLRVDNLAHQVALALVLVATTRGRHLRARYVDRATHVRKKMEKSE
jgi:hypothetical protein